VTCQPNRSDRDEEDEEKKKNEEKKKSRPSPLRPEL
jgi:hypothetical protein